MPGIVVVGMDCGNEISGFGVSTRQKSSEGVPLLRHIKKRSVEINTTRHTQKGEKGSPVYQQRGFGLGRDVLAVEPIGPAERKPLAGRERQFRLQEVFRPLDHLARMVGECGSITSGRSITSTKSPDGSCFRNIMYLLSNYPSTIVRPKGSIWRVYFPASR